MSAIVNPAKRRTKSRIYCELATTISDIRGSQALRYRVFARMNRLRRHAMSVADCRVAPRRPLPPLLKACFRLGARACGEPCYDPAFDRADVMVLVNVRDIDASYTRHFLDRITKG